MLRGFLKLPVKRVEGAGRLPSSHSLKTTGLSWAAKFGLAPAVRATLGRHAYATASSEAIYSRDLAVEPVRKFADVIKQIAARTFLPDSLRSGYFSFPPSPPLLAGPTEPQDVETELRAVVKEEAFAGGQMTDGPVLVEASSEDDGSESSSASISDASEDDAQAPAKRCRVEDVPGQRSWFMHRASRKLHLLSGQQEKSVLDRVFACGRAFSDSYTRAFGIMLQNDKCAMCCRGLPGP